MFLNGTFAKVYNQKFNSKTVFKSDILLCTTSSLNSEQVELQFCEHNLEENVCLTDLAEFLSVSYAIC